VDVPNERRAPRADLLDALLIAGPEPRRVVLVRDSVDADVDDDRPGLDHLARHEGGPSDRCDQDVGAPGGRREIARPRMTDRHRAVLPKEEDRDGLADDVAPAEDDGLAPLEGHAAALEDLDDPGRRAGKEAGHPGRHPTGVQWVQSVDVLVGGDRQDRLASVQPRGEGELEEDPVDLRVRAQPADRRHQLALGRPRAEPHELALHAGGRASARLVPDVDLRSRIFPDQDDREARDDAPRPMQTLDPGGDLGPDLGGQRLSVEDPRASARMPARVSGHSPAACAFAHGVAHFGGSLVNSTSKPSLELSESTMLNSMRSRFASSFLTG
jgi:hypothetical protein